MMLVLSATFSLYKGKVDSDVYGIMCVFGLMEIAAELTALLVILGKVR